MLTAKPMSSKLKAVLVEFSIAGWYGSYGQVLSRDFSQPSFARSCTFQIKSLMQR